MIELLIVVAILALLALIIFSSLRLSMMRARDAQRKGHLEKLKVALEDYYNDKGCYPPIDIFFDGGTAPAANLCDKPLAAMQPYLDKVPCDPTTRLPYAYYAVEGGQICSGYRLYVQLEDRNDQGIPKVGCTKDGCGALTQFNYGVATGGSLVAEEGGGVDPTPTPGGPTPTAPPGGYFVCSPNGIPTSDGGNGPGKPYCKQYSDPDGAGCPNKSSDLSTCYLTCPPDAAPSQICRD